MKVHFAFQAGGLCFRLSAYPLTYSAAVAQCQSETTELAYVPSQGVQNALAAIIASKKASLSYYAAVKQFWLGALPVGDGSKVWNWLDKGHSMADYSNWKTLTTGG